MSYEDLKNRHPELNWSEAENEIDDSDLDAASDMFDRLVSERKERKDSLQFVGSVHNGRDFGYVFEVR